MKSENNKKNHKSCQNQATKARFSKSNDPTIGIAVS
jgi:hypothetical protein